MFPFPHIPISLELFFQSDSLQNVSSSTILNTTLSVYYLPQSSSKNPSFSKLEILCWMSFFSFFITVRRNSMFEINLSQCLSFEANSSSFLEILAWGESSSSSSSENLLFIGLDSLISKGLDVHLAQTQDPSQAGQIHSSFLTKASSHVNPSSLFSKHWRHTTALHSVQSRCSRG